MPLAFLLWYLLPDPNTVERRDSGIIRIFSESTMLRYRRWYFTKREQIAAWHRSELARLDYLFRLREAQDELVRRRERAHASGMSAGDPSYPTLRDILPASDFGLSDALEGRRK